MKVRYRFARPDDAPALGVLHTRSWQAAYAGLIGADELAALDPAERADSFATQLDPDFMGSRQVVWLVAEQIGDQAPDRLDEPGRLLGHAVAQRIGGQGHLHMLYVDPDSLGQGVGHELHDMALRGLHRFGCDSVKLKVLDGNDRAIGFYERHGWRFTGERFDEEILGIALSDLEMSIELDVDVLTANRRYWNDQAGEYASWAPRAWDGDRVSLGVFGLDAEAIFPHVDGCDVVELGCGTGYVSGWCLGRGAASATGIDNSPLQLATAQRLAAERESPLRLVHGDAHATPFADDSFDVAINEYGAAIWCDPRVWIPEAARILRPGGRLWFLGNSVAMMLCAPEFEGQPASPTMLRPQRDMHRFEWIDTPNVEFHVGHGEMIAILTGAGFVVDALHELYVDPDTTTDCGFVDAEWASRWPVEEVWAAHLAE